MSEESGAMAKVSVQQMGPEEVDEVSGISPTLERTMYQQQRLRVSRHMNHCTANRVSLAATHMRISR